MLGITKFIKEVTKSVTSFFVVFGGVFMVKINGEELNIAGKTVAEYLADAHYDPKRIAIERNGEIVPKAQYGETVLQDGDSIELVRFVGGG
jgi:sulfur carrier protein